MQAAGESALVPLVRTKIGQPSPKAQQIIKAGELAGVPVKTTDVVPPETIVGGLTRQFAERVPFIGTGGVRGSQQVARKDAIQEWASKIPPVDDKAVMDSIKRKKDRIKAAASER